MQRQCLMAAKTSFTINLPPQALVMIEQLQPKGLYGSNRGEITRQLVLDQLKELAARGVVTAPS